MATLSVEARLRARAGVKLGPDCSSLARMSPPDWTLAIGVFTAIAVLFFARVT
jgi:hypothetical protein